MLDEQAKENVRKDIQTILKTAIVVDSTLDEYGSELCERLERTAEALQKTFEMEDSLMEDFRWRRPGNKIPGNRRTSAIWTQSRPGR